MPEGGLAAGEDTEEEKEDDPEAVEDTELVLKTDTGLVKCQLMVVLRKSFILTSRPIGLHWKFFASYSIYYLYPPRLSNDRQTGRKFKSPTKVSAAQPEPVFKKVLCCTVKWNMTIT